MKKNFSSKRIGYPTDVRASLTIAITQLASLKRYKGVMCICAKIYLIMVFYGYIVAVNILNPGQVYSYVNVLIVGIHLVICPLRPCFYVVGENIFCSTGVSNNIT